jgi:hypothetical protein
MPDRTPGKREEGRPILSQLKDNCPMTHQMAGQEIGRKSRLCAQKGKKITWRENTTRGIDYMLFLSRYKAIGKKTKKD